MSGAVVFVVPVVVESGLWCDTCQLSTGHLFEGGLMTEQGFSPNAIRLRICERCERRLDDSREPLS